MIVYPSGEDEFTSSGMFSALHALIRSTEQRLTPGGISGRERMERPAEDAQ